MARTEIPLVVVNNSGVPLASASITVNVRGGSAATVYLAEAGGTTVTNPMLSDSRGRVEGWLERGSYTAVVSHASITTYSVDFESVSGRDGTVDTAFIADSAVTTPKIPDNAITSAKILADAVTSAKIPDSAISTAKIADGAVTAAKIPDGSVTKAKLAADVIFGSGNFGIAFTADPRVPMSASVIAANIVRYSRAYGTASVSSLVIRVGVSAGNIDVGIYSSSGTGRSNVPLTKQRSSGSVACPAAGDATVSVGSAFQVLDAQHWFALGTTSATASFFHVTTTQVITALAAGLNGQQAVAIPLPTTAAPTETNTGTPVIVGA